MRTHARAAVQVAANRTEIRTMPMPDVGRDGALLRVLAAGVCGSDVAYYADAALGERILGHENVGAIEALGEHSPLRARFTVGDVVALEEYVPCGSCGECRAGEYRSCARTDVRAGALRYGWTPLDVAPGWWGGFAQYLYVHPDALVHAVPDGVPARLAAMALPLGNGVQWACLDGGASPGDVVVVFGPGQQGLACAVAAKAAGARVVVVGLSRDAHRLGVARVLGADATLRADADDVARSVRELSGGAGARLVIDVSSGGASSVVSAALDVVAKRGTVLLAAYKGAPLDAFPIDIVIRKQVTIRGVRGHSYAAVETALANLAGGGVDVTPMATHTLALDDVDRAIRMVGDGDAIHVAVVPDATSSPR